MSLASLEASFDVLIDSVSSPFSSFTTVWSLSIKILAIFTASSSRPPGLFLKSNTILRTPSLWALIIADLSSPAVLSWNLFIVNTPMLSFFLYSTLFTWILPRFILISFSWEPRFIVSLTVVPSLPRTNFTTWSKGLPTTDFPSTLVTTSFGWIPAFSALVIIICLSFFCISAPMPTKSPETSSLKLFVSSLVMYSEYGSLSSLTMPSIAASDNLPAFCFL